MYKKITIGISTDYFTTIIIDCYSKRWKEYKERERVIRCNRELVALQWCNNGIFIWSLLNEERKKFQILVHDSEYSLFYKHIQSSWYCNWTSSRYRSYCLSSQYKARSVRRKHKSSDEGYFQETYTIDSRRKCITENTTESEWIPYFDGHIQTAGYNIS